MVGTALEEPGLEPLGFGETPVVGGADDFDGGGEAKV